MIFHHTTPDPAAPLWLLHFESLTLARLILHPGGPHALHIQCHTPPPDEAFQEFNAAIESMGTGVSRGLTMITHPQPGHEEPVALTLAPLTGTGFATILRDIEVPGRIDIHTRLAIGHLESGPIGPIWENRPESETARRAIIALALRHASHATRSDLDDLTPDLWMKKPTPISSFQN